MSAVSRGERRARLGLCGLLPMATPALAHLVEQYGAEEVWAAVLGEGGETRWGRKAAAVNLDGIQAATRVCGARFVVPGDDDWPERLAGLAPVEVNGQGGAPFGLWVRGTLPSFDGAVAMVGSSAVASTPAGAPSAT